jgi:hypothetical protein
LYPSLLRIPPSPHFNTQARPDVCPKRSHFAGWLAYHDAMLSMSALL